jgi:hypothetical protein
MSSSKAKTRQKRRDRRKAKASDWRRQPKQMGGSHVGHGTSGSHTVIFKTKTTKE